MSRFSLGIILSLTALSVLACNQSGAPAGANGQWGGGNRRQPTIMVQAAKAQSGNLVTERTASGVVVATTQSQVAAPVSGIVARVNHLAGSWVDKGTIVVQLDDQQLRLSLANAQAAYENAKINLAIGEDAASQANPKLELQVQSAQSALDAAQKNYDAQKALFALGGTSAASVDSSLSSLQLAQANLTAAKTALDQNKNSGSQNLAQLRISLEQAKNLLAQAQLNVFNAAVRAPFAGQIASVPVAPGMFVGSATTVFVLMSGEKQVSFSVAPAEAAIIKPDIQLNYSYGSKTYSLRLDAAPAAPINGMTPLTAHFVGAADIQFGSVGSVNYKVIIGQGVIVPISALQSMENRIFVFGIHEGKIQTHRVAIIAETGAQAAVSGIDPGSVVVINAPPGLVEGSSVQPLMADAPNSLPGSEKSAQPGPEKSEHPGQGGHKKGIWQGKTKPNGTQP